MDVDLIQPGISHLQSIVLLDGFLNFLPHLFPHLFPHLVLTFADQVRTNFPASCLSFLPPGNDRSPQLLELPPHLANSLTNYLNFPKIRPRSLITVLVVLN